MSDTNMVIFCIYWGLALMPTARQEMREMGECRGVSSYTYWSYYSPIIISGDRVITEASVDISIYMHLYEYFLPRLWYLAPTQIEIEASPKQNTSCSAWLCRLRMGQTSTSMHIFNTSTNIQQFLNQYQQMTNNNNYTKSWLTIRPPYLTMIRIRAAMERYPSLTKGTVSGLLLSLSDAISQLAIEKNQQFNWKRNFEFLVLGLGWIAPCIQIWYSKILPKITARYLSHMPKPKKIIYRLIIDTLIFAPVTYTGFYLIKDVIFKPGRDFQNIQAEIYEKYIRTLLADWVLWAPVNFVNFWWVPTHWQGLYVGVFSFFFNVILSYLSNKELEHEKKEKLEKLEKLEKQTKIQKIGKQVMQKFEQQKLHEQIWDPSKPHTTHEKIDHLKDVAKSKAHPKNIQIIL